MKELTLERLKELVTYDPLTGVFTCNKVSNLCRKEKGDRVGCRHKTTGYRVLDLDGKTYPEHRVAFFYMTGSWPGPEVDHLNRIRDDNRWENLEDSDRLQNAKNRGLNKNNSTGVRGVQRGTQRGKEFFQVQVCWDRQNYYFGKFDSVEDASAVANRFYEDPAKFLSERNS